MRKNSNILAVRMKSFIYSLLEYMNNGKPKVEHTSILKEFSGFPILIPNCVKKLPLGHSKSYEVRN